MLFLLGSLQFVSSGYNHFEVNEVKKVNEFIEKEKLLSELEYELVKDFIIIRKNQKLTQQEVANQSNVIRETIARIENSITSPQVNTLIKILEPLGYTIKIVPLERKEK